jgi:hypothetical protein
MLGDIRDVQAVLWKAAAEWLLGGKKPLIMSPGQVFSKEELLFYVRQNSVASRSVHPCIDSYRDTDSPLSWS